MKVRIENGLAAAGYRKLLSNKPEFTIYFQEQSRFINAVSVLDMTSGLDILPETFVHMNEKVKWRFMDRGYEDVHVLSVVITEDRENALKLLDEDTFGWIVDANNCELYIPDDKIEDFYGLKRFLVDGLSATFDEGQNDNIDAYDISSGQKVIPFKDRPLINHGIFILNVLVFTLCTLSGEVLYNIGIMSPKEIVENGQWYRMITSIFLHADMDHIVGNMLLLFFLGNIVERSLGHIKYFFLYMAAGLAGNFLSLAYSYWQLDFVGSLGASGAVYGAIGALLWILMRNKGFLENIALPRLIFLVGYSLYLGFTSTNVDNAAHIGGLLTGFLLGVLLYRKKRGKV